MTQTGIRRPTYATPTDAAAAHHGLTWDVRGLEYGRVMLGLPAKPEQATGSVL
jgi:hypothetical protein